jgi:hypothetical protein
LTRRRAAFATPGDDITQLKTMVRDGDIDGAMEGLQKVQRGEKSVPAAGAAAEHVPGCRRHARRTAYVERTATLVPTRATSRAEAERAIRKYQISEAIKSAHAEGVIERKDMIRLFAKLNQGKVVDVLKAMPKGFAPDLSKPTMTAGARKFLRRGRNAIFTKMREIAEEAEHENEVQELSVNDLGQIRDTFQSKPGVNAKRMAKMLGPQLYGDPTDMGKVTIKEILQNSYDAIKSMQLAGTLSKGKINISTSNGGHTITMTDNGAGMSPALLGGKFLEIAGTGKETDAASGGFGIAKMLFLYGNEELDVVTLRDGVLSHLSTSGPELFDSLEDPNKAPMIETSTLIGENTRQMFPDGHGTIIRVTTPRTYSDPNDR